jgi:predicted SAM-dependent methyltransferase
MLKKIVRKVLNSDNSLSRFSVTLLRDYRVKKFNDKGYKVLEVSGGSMPLSKEYLNIDISEASEVDLVTNLLETIPVEDNYADKIISIATLEHFNVNDVRKILAEFKRILKPGGVLEIGVPSLEKILVEYKKRGCDDEVLRYLHGGLKDKYDIHFFVVDAKRFISELESVGFSKAAEAEYDFPRHSKDMMMKIVAEKGS